MVQMIKDRSYTESSTIWACHLQPVAMCVLHIELYTTNIKLLTLF